MQRPTAAQAQRDGAAPPPPFTLVIDEVQSFATDELAHILSEARKYGLRLVLANQFTTQLRPPVREAIFGNVGSVIAFRVGAADAELLSREFNDEIPRRRFSDLANFTVIAKLADASGVSSVLVGETLPLQHRHHGYGKSIVRLCRQRFGRPRDPRPARPCG